MALDGLPGPARRDAHLLVVVSGRPARGERVIEPEAVLARDAVGDVGQGRRAAVGGHHEVRVVAVVADDLGRWDDLTRGERVREIE